MHSSSSQHRPAATRWDVVIGIFLGFMMITLVVPWLAMTVLFPHRTREPATRTLTINNLKGMALALHSHNDVFGRLPPAFDSFGKFTFPVSIHVHLLPFIEQDPLYEQLRFKAPQMDVQIVPLFLDPLDESFPSLKGVQNFGANLRIFTDKGVETPYNVSLPELNHVEPGTAAIPRTFVDGTSNTIVFSTRLAACGEGGSRYIAAPDSPFGAYIGQNAAQVAAHPTDTRATFLLAPSSSECTPRPFMPHSIRNVGVFVGLGDGSVRTLSSTLTPETWNRAMQPNDELALGTDW